MLGSLVWGCASAPAQSATHRERVHAGGGIIEVAIHEASTFSLPVTAILDWVKRAGVAVSIYYGHFPVSRGAVEIFPGRRDRGVGGGMSFGNPVRCRIHAGVHTTAEDLADDWMLTHEMVHWAFPSVEENHHWIEEGSATYVEPIARALAGQLNPVRVWSEMRRDMPQGLPAPGDQGLDRTPTWGRTYWGGALFCLLADIGIRERSSCRFGLEDALRAINREGGTIDADWKLSRALAIGDRATKGSTLSDLYRQMSTQPAPVDLLALWAKLGFRGDTVTDDAPLAAVRRAILPLRVAE
jgi:hypothetical protein